MSRHHLPRREVPGINDTYIEPNQDYSCFSIRQENIDDEDLIHFCDWRELVKAITEFMTERERIAKEDGEI